MSMSYLPRAVCLLDRQWLRGTVHFSQQLAEVAIPDHNMRDHPNSGTGPTQAAEQFTRLGKRKKCAVMLSYCGAGYMGMYRNKDVPSIEDDLIIAMMHANAFPKSYVNDLGKLHFDRCSRTDKGVSAVQQLVSLKIVAMEDSVALINAHLPPQIRVMAVKRVKRGFSARHYCGARTYEYLLPTYAFAPSHQTTPDYRIPDSTLSLVAKLLARYEGTHKFHNFTAGKKFDDHSTNRTVTSFKCGERFLAKCIDDSSTEIEFITLKIKGASFMLHQIRKMIGFVITLVKGLATDKDLERAFQNERVDIPRAPALGLYLENLCFDGYNANFCKNGERPKLDWHEYESEINKFKREFILRHIIETELREMSMMSWLRKLDFHDFYQSERYFANTENRTTQLDH